MSYIDNAVDALAVRNEDQDDLLRHLLDTYTTGVCQSRPRVDQHKRVSFLQIAAKIPEESRISVMKFFPVKFLDPLGIFIVKTARLDDGKARNSGFHDVRGKSINGLATDPLKVASCRIFITCP